MSNSPSRARRPRTRRLTIIAQDPSVRSGAAILRTAIELPREPLGPGPWGHRVHVVDYDASQRRLYRPWDGAVDADPYHGASDETLLHDPRFHQQNVYAIAMRTLGRFERALGRRVDWGFQSHQLMIAPHAFAEANAFYSRRDHGLYFGYFFTSDDTPIFTSLSHDVVAHETAHALLDGLRQRYGDPSSPDQAAFHEGFSDVVALLSVFSLSDVVDAVLTTPSPNDDPGLAEVAALTREQLRAHALLSLAQQMGAALSPARGDALRRSATLTPATTLLGEPQYLEPHRRGEVFVAAMLNAFLDVWVERLGSLGQVRPGYYARSRVVEEGATAAERLLDMLIRGLDYAPPVNVSFGDILSAMITADRELLVADAHDYRATLKRNFAAFGILPSADPNEWDEPPEEDGAWSPAPTHLSYDGVHLHSLQHEPNEVLRFLFDNRGLLGIDDLTYTRVLSVRPCRRIGPDGFVLHETVAEYMQLVKLKARELAAFGVQQPPGMPDDTEVKLYAGGSLLFNEFGTLRFHVRNRLRSSAQNRRLAYLWEHGFYTTTMAERLAEQHRARAMSAAGYGSEGGSW